MPHINRIRVNNVRYNFGTQYYDDFLMRFSGKNTIYDLANGGGKSVLMLLLLQNMLPNCTLDEKQPVEKLFRTGNGSTTIHSLVEWKLSDTHIKDNYKYMLTGFCARKAKDSSEEENKDTATIEYFNYCIFYREFNDNDIKNLPLKKGNERITYNGLKNYLRELDKRDLSLKIEIFERKGEYQRFIADYGIYESEWEIIRGINKTEGHVRTYFESNYKTTRKVVEDLLIEEIIQKAFNSKAYGENREDIMAKTLIGIKDKLVNLLKSKEDINNYDRQTEVIKDFSGRVNIVKELYYGRESLVDEIVRCYYTILDMIKKGEVELAGCESEAAGISEIIAEHKREVETAGILKEMARLSEYTKKLSELDDALNKETKNINNLKEKLSICESINDYADYLYYKKERDSLTVMVDNILKDKGELIRQLKELSSVKHERNKKKYIEIEGEIEKNEKIISMEEELLNQLKEEDIKAEKQMAVSEYLIEDCNSRLGVLTDKINEKRGEYQGVLSLEPAKDKIELENEYEKLMEEKTTLRSQYEKAVKEQESLNSKKEEIRSSIENNDSMLSVCIDEKEEGAKLEEKIKKLSQIYGEKNLIILKDIVDFRYNEATEELLKLKNERDILNNYIISLRNGIVVPLSEEIKNVYSYIVRYYGNIAVLGAEFVKALSVEKKKSVLEINPLLPYSILIKENYHTIAADTGLKELSGVKTAVPILRFEAVKNGIYAVDSSNLSFVMCNQELFYNEELIEKKQIKINEEISSIDFKISQLEETAELLKGDSRFISEYINGHMERYEEIQDRYESLKQERKELDSLSTDIAENIRNIAEVIFNITKETEKLEKREEELTEKLAVVNCLMDYSKEQMIILRTLNEKEQALKAAKSKYETTKARLMAQENQLAARKKNVNLLKKEIEETKSVWDSVYKAYYREDIKAESSLEDMELEARFMGLKEACESDMSDVSDKQKLINNYDLAMEKSLTAIDYNGVFLEDVKEYYDKGEYTVTSKEELKNIKKQIEDGSKRADDIHNEITGIRTLKDKAEGSIEKGKLKIVEKYGEYVELSIENTDIDMYISNRREEIAGFERKLSEINDNLRLIEKNNQKYIILQRDIDKIISNAKINVGTEEKLFVGIGDIEEKIGQIVEKNDKFLKEMYDKREQFEKEKQMLVDILVKMGAEPLADEMRTNIVLPESVSEAEELSEALIQIVDCITLEKERVLKSIEDMEKIKDSFENQCIQTCLNIKNELDRLPKLSKINMDGEIISIISLNIPYIKEDQYKLSMEKYIDDTVNVADSMKNETERLKYIRNQLSFKKLFSAIVQDMNGIKLNLYKRERIKEQSRYLKYEEAVGSTGQSQGIYIQFLIAVINYISSINSKGSEGVGLKKAVFIDNPFGAAKDIYIWEPIFKLLKTNSVQLIVPARGTTPAITGRFDVNYILGQKLIDGKQQTVVVDYCSNVDNEQMDYETLTYEQTTLF